jgi:hypothetical protein
VLDLARQVTGRPSRARPRWRIRALPGVLYTTMPPYDAGPATSLGVPSPGCPAPGYSHCLRATTGEQPPAPTSSSSGAGRAHEARRSSPRPASVERERGPRHRRCRRRSAPTAGAGARTGARRSRRGAHCERLPGPPEREDRGGCPSLHAMTGSGGCSGTVLRPRRRAERPAQQLHRRSVRPRARRA